MELYNIINRYNTKDVVPEHEFKGELIHYAQVSSFPYIVRKVRLIVVSVERRSDNNKLHLYYNGTRVWGKIVSKDKPLQQESMSFIDAIAVDIKLGVID